MLEELDIKNFALIDSSHVEFEKGFTVLSGETGAGKSILIGSLAFLLGGKCSVEQIRTGCHEAVVSGLFLLDSKEAFDWLSEHGIESEDDRILIRRIVRDTGKSSAWIGSVPVTRADLADFASFLVDIHGQHEQQSLMKISEHRRYLDIYADIVPQVEEFKKLFQTLVEKRRILDEMNSNEEGRLREIEMLSFAVQEIESAKLKVHEQEELELEESKLASFEKLYGDIEELKQIFEDGFGQDSGLLSMLKKADSVASHAQGFDQSLESVADRIQSSYYELEDISQEVKHYLSSLVFDPDRLEEVQSRLELISKLKKKYVNANSTVQELLDYKANAEKRLETLGGASGDRSVLENQVKELEKTVYIKAKEISEKRKAASDKMSLQIQEILSKLGMKDASFAVSLTQKEGNDVEQRCGPYGMDDVEFLISANKGSPLLPLTKIASGGELSRVMLALKTILCAADTMNTLVFDEIDTGIGGEVAVAVGEHMKKLAAKKQILCITHLASIAVYADNQIKIQKGVETGASATSTNVFKITGQERVSEIARMLSGDSDSAQSLEHAASMLKKFGGI